jgi:hypothetical protein
MHLIHYARKIRMNTGFPRFANAPGELIALVARDDPNLAMEDRWYSVQCAVCKRRFITEE